MAFSREASVKNAVIFTGMQRSAEEVQSTATSCLASSLLFETVIFVDWLRRRSLQIHHQIISESPDGDSGSLHLMDTL